MSETQLATRDPVASPLTYVVTIGMGKPAKHFAFSNEPEAMTCVRDFALKRWGETLARSLNMSRAPANWPYAEKTFPGLRVLHPQTTPKESTALAIGPTFHITGFRAYIREMTTTDFNKEFYR